MNNRCRFNKLPRSQRKSSRARLGLPFLQQNSKRKNIISPVANSTVNNEKTNTDLRWQNVHVEYRGTTDSAARRGRYAASRIIIQFAKSKIYKISFRNVETGILRILVSCV